MPAGAAVRRDALAGRCLHRRVMAVAHRSPPTPFRTGSGTFGVTIKKILLVKTSSLGDVIHLLPALTDAHRRYPEVRFHWLVEEAFAEIPSWHPAVERVIPVAQRRWRTFSKHVRTLGEFYLFIDMLRC